MGNDSLFVSTGILCYNQEPYIAQTIESILSQKTTFPFELIIGDDSSTDKTREIAEEYQRKYPDIIRLMPKAPNKGVLKNYRDVIASCRGKYVALCSGDDYWHNPLKLQKQVDILENNPEYGLVHTDVDYYYQKTGKIVHNRYSKKNFPKIDGFVFEQILKGQFYIVSVTACYLRSAIINYIDFNSFIENKFAFEDLPTWLELSRHIKFKYLDESTVTYRVLPNSISHPVEKDKKLRYIDHTFEIRSYYISKYQIDAQTQKVVNIAYHRRRFSAAFKYFYRRDAQNSFLYLKNIGAVDKTIRLKAVLLRFPVLYRLTKSVSTLLKMDVFVSDVI